MTSTPHHNPKKLSRSRLVLIVAGAVVAVLLAATAWLGWTAMSSDSGKDVRIFIPANASTEAVADSVMKAVGPAYGRKVMTMWALMGGDPAKARGSYLVKDGTRAYRTARQMDAGRQSPVRVTFNNVRLMSDLADRIAARMAFTPADFLAAADSLLPAEDFKSEQFPAAFVPDSYEFFWTDSASKVVNTLLSYQRKFWTAERKAKAEKLGLTPVQVATLASIVEEETANAEERGMVARLYLNRLEKGMKLQADPTVKFAEGNFALRRIGGAMLGNPSPYNTYVHPGLPPGPIRIPEKATIDAVLNAKPHPYIYMCAKADFGGRHDFAVDFATHRANAERYRQALDRRGIKH